MPLSKIQIAALGTIAAARDAESYIAGSTPLNRGQQRYSADIDIFHDREERVAKAAEADAASLVADGFSVRWLRRDGAVHTLAASRDGDEVRLDWVADSTTEASPTTTHTHKAGGMGRRASAALEIAAPVLQPPQPQGS